jgi:peptidoglycan-associated lipoprotein
MINTCIKRFGSLSVTAVMLVLLASCSSTDEEMTQSLTPEPAAAPVQQGTSAAELAEMRKREQMLAVTVFYFDFDKSDLKPEARDSLTYHAQRLKENASMRVRLEGHADERGTPEYNLALGERRAIAVQRYLQVQGVPASQMEVISYGEERPSAQGTGESNWSRNRRVEMKF